MKLCRFGPPGREKPGLVDGAGTVRDLTGIVADIDPAVLSPAGLSQLSNLDPAALPPAPDGVRLGVPFMGTSKIVAVGLNYADHAKEAGLPVPEEVITFMKAVSSLSGPFDDVVLPKDSAHADWEVELGVVIGREMSYVDEADALDHVAGYVVANDVSERFDQKERGSQWSKGKGHDTFCPTGPWLVTKDEVPDPQDLSMWLELNGDRMQDGSTRTMIFSVAESLAYISRFVTLMPGDLVITGTPPGVGEGQKPDKIFLKEGDVMRLGIEGLGEQQQRVASWRPRNERGA
ncbi:fumarylacetoacetate hydrolase family protein [Parvularcula dongshanensis]|uniref:2-keto-4-pentenoate hydratase/2-oxohepta-3-ene-1,7-dioic acid hydratase in catechol pathway n=1 Tax=Parvularcula dongshanensis TaxID=1173995 RepID=A0A840I5B4_9PROT|nr:fumarylacetoacetate hydrolase family protein [Parvularcula dongshanensis]MBB4659572.1 2-keto-4-pentenoate hydratase/2-oxohepta-3-ene-1,7-dioic acid hydratase in catechol pathway [Parvularcula dongshanensis]